MGFVKPTINQNPKPWDTRQERGKTVNPPTLVDFGGFNSLSKVMKSKRMRTDRPEKGGPFTKVSG